MTWSWASFFIGAIFGTFGLILFAIVMAEDKWH